MKPFQFLRGSLRGRVLLLVGLWMIALVIILMISNFMGSRELSDRVFRERQRLAQALADNLDNILKSHLVLLQDVAFRARASLEKRDLGAVKVALREFYVRSLFAEGAFLLDKGGKVIWVEPRYPPGEQKDFSSLPPVRLALEGGRPAISNFIGNGKKRIYAVVPVRNWHGEVVGAVGGEMDLESVQFRSLLHPVEPGETSYLDIVDGNGSVLASTKPNRAFTESDHGRFLAGLIQEKKSVVGSCHSCHEKRGFPVREVIAFAPLTVASWGVSIRQAEREAMAPGFAMERRFLLIGSVTILMALLFAWGVARSVTKPLAVLGQASQRIARGNLDEPVSPLGTDEIGHLGESLDQMREALKASLETIAEGKRDLEKRVQERTRELEGLYLELQKKEEIRGELLRKVITVQEEERKRIARELHDETSQALATLLLSIETSGSGAPEQIRERLAQMKRLTNQTLENVHRMIFDLRPSFLDDLGLVSTLRWAGESRLEPMGIDLLFEVVGAERRLGPEVETTLFRVGQEAISNIAKHAEANSVKITVDFGEDRLRLQVEDDGKGFVPETVPASGEAARGLGLLGMKERAALIGGTFTIDSESGKGTCVCVEVPLGKG
ncbi:MAG: HAMP domain-containing protein [Deltaproteobacteria bacterium]|nr:HAMP domain-containing protein [Deltaproteobacteria bacterium]